MSTYKSPLTPPQTSSQILVSFPAPHVLLITFNRPESLNAMSFQMSEDMRATLDWFESEPELWVVVVTGKGRAFCAGADLKSWNNNQQSGNSSEQQNLQSDAYGFGSISRRQSSGKPLIAAVNGLAFGGGMEMITNCDLVVASEDAKFALPEVKRGVVAIQGGIPRLTAIAGRQLASEMLLTGTPITAKDARDRFHFVNVVTPPNLVLQTALSLADTICQNSPDAVQSTKIGITLFNKYAVDPAYQENVWREESGRVYKGANIKEGLKAFVEVDDDTLSTLQQHIKDMPQMDTTPLSTDVYILPEDLAIEMYLTTTTLAEQDWLALAKQGLSWVSPGQPLSQFTETVKVPESKYYVIVICQFSRETFAGTVFSAKNAAEWTATYTRNLLSSSYLASMNEALISTQNIKNIAAIYNGRPRALTGPSIGIYHPIFRKFQLKAAKQPSQHELATNPSMIERLRAASRLLTTSARYFANEIDRHNALAPDMKILLPTGKFTTSDTTSKFGDLEFEPSGHRLAKCSLATSMLSLLWELKNGMGLGGADPLEQAARGYMIMATSEELTELRKISCLPVFLLGIAGPNLTFSGAIYLDGVVTQHLTDYISLIPFSKGKLDEYLSPREELVYRIAHIFSVLDECLVDLDKYYATIETAVCHPLFPAPHFNTFIDDANERCDLTYTRRQFRPRSPRTVFQATLTSPTHPGRDCMVKFTTQYNADAHRLMHQAGVAPELLYCKYEPGVGKICVVSEFIPNDPSKFPTDEAIEKLRAGLKVLHENDYVFGNLRDANILVNNDGNVFLVGFDWCDKVAAFYPLDLVPEITWATGVQKGEDITKAHDEEMLEIYIAFVHKQRQAIETAKQFA
ncbi:hypothetical protein ONZ45_g5899 [Pleurotus djamor]|nr:hypothetical protein ONZ45_g5899 [Pleurotus djamor]